MRKRLSVVVSALMVTGALVLPTTSARAATTYEIQVGQDFFEAGVPGFSQRFYPGSITVQTGDTLHFLPGFLKMGSVGAAPQQHLNEDDAQVGNPGGLLDFDADDGDDALKFNLGHIFFFGGDECGAIDNPCVWGTNSDPIVPLSDSENGDVYVEIQAAPGTTLWATAVLPNSDVNSTLKVEVVTPAEEASTQTELDERAASLIAKDYEDALALHSKMKAKQTSHVNAAGKKVYDVFVGAAAGPIEMFASYPRTTKISKGDRVQFHFMYQGEVHTATFGGAEAKDVFQNLLVPSCDPDGDEGAGPDVEPVDFDPETGFPICPEGAELEGEVHPLAPWTEGDGKVQNASDYENSGFQLPNFPEPGTFDVNEDPWTVAFPKTSSKKGFKYICLIHGGFMGGKVVVR